MDSAATIADETMETNKTNAKNSAKPGRKFGLTGQQRQQQPQQQVQHGMASPDGRRFSVREEGRNSWTYSLSEQEMEDKYNAICLAIRTENLTLGQRLEHQHAERDLVENNLSQEVRVLHSLFISLKQEVARSSQTSLYRDGLSSGGWNEMFIKVANQLDAVHSSATRISSSAESLGAVEYEARLSAAVQVLILYVDHIKRKWEKEHHELEETKRILKESGVNVAQCLAALPDRLANYSSGATTTAATGPVSKRRASFPAAPLRRISLKPPPLVNLRVSTLLLEPSAGISDPVSAITIAEEREDVDSDQPSLKERTGMASPSELQQSSCITPSPSSPAVRNNDNKASASPGVSVTIRRRGVGGGLKSHSWSSGHGSGLLDRRESSDKAGPSAGIKPGGWLTKAGQWSHLQLSQWRKTAATYRSSYRQQWTSLRHKKLQLLRYSASACFLLAALVSLVITFVPSSAGSGQSSSLANATVLPGRAGTR